MEIFETEKFSFEGVGYETRVMETNEGIAVAVFKTGERANPYRYSVDTMTDKYMLDARGYRGYEHLMEMAKSDVLTKKFENYLKAVNKK